MAMTDRPTGESETSSPRVLPDPGRPVGPANLAGRPHSVELARSVPDQFEQQVLRTPDRLALRDARHEYSYASLNETANRIAHAILAERGEGVEPIALLFEHGALMVAAILGALKAGKIYVPLDPANPRTRTGFILADSQARLIVTDTLSLPLGRELAGEGIVSLCIEAPGTHTPTTNPGLQLSPDTLANILYTSGSTGQPKGVLQDHRHLLEETRLYTDAFQINAQDRLCLQHSCSFAASVRRIFPALLNGAALFPLDTRKEGVRVLPEWLAREQITVTQGRHLLQKCEDALTGPAQFPHIRLLTFGGDRTYRSDWEKFCQYLPEDCRMVVNLASTEAGTVTRYLLDKQTRITGGVLPVGFPADGKQVRLLDEAGHEVAAGEEGEIVVQGRVLFRGYWRRPDLTEAALRSVPETEDERIFHTGDLGRLLPDGSLMHLGRKDFQVKIRGYRIETGEVEMALREAAAARDAVVTARQDQFGDSRLVAYLVPGEQPPTGSTLRRALAARLPEYMVPSAFVILEQLPRTATGKVDRNALPAPGRARPALDAAYAPPRSPIEQTLVQVWADVLEVETVGVHDPFLDLGGNSLLATRIIARLREALAVELPLRSFFEHSTVAAAAVVIAQELAAQAQPGELLHLIEELEQLTEAETHSRMTPEPS
jgi:amino acid adenylation domain-containing protein